MSYCLLFHCFFFEHYLEYSTTWVLAFALSIFFGLVSLRLSCSVICIFLQHMVVSQKENMIFRLSLKFRIYILVTLDYVLRSKPFYSTQPYSICQLNRIQ